MVQVTKEMIDAIQERHDWEKATFERWWIGYRAYHPEDNYPEDAPKEVRQAFTAALSLLRERRAAQKCVGKKKYVYIDDMYSCQVCELYNPDSENLLKNPCWTLYEPFDHSGLDPETMVRVHRCNMFQYRGEATDGR